MKEKVITMTDLEAKAFSQFDRLVGMGELLWQENTPRYIDFKSFKVRLCEICRLWPAGLQ